MCKNNAIKYLNVYPPTEEDRNKLKVFELLKQAKGMMGADIAQKTGVPEAFVAEYINDRVKKDMLEISAGGEGRLVNFLAGKQKLLGIGFNNRDCILTAMDLTGKVLDREKIDVGFLDGVGGKNKDVSAIVKKLDAATKLKGSKFASIGIAVPRVLVEKNGEAAEILGSGIHKIFKGGVFATDAATAAGYAEKDLGAGREKKNILYVHSDTGAGVILKDEIIFEAGGEDEKRAYLTPWNQFGMVHVIKDLIRRGLGTDILDMVKGDVESITTEIVMKAAGQKDELAEDIVKRAALALGVRVAYLTNIFDPGIIIMGGGIEKQKGDFIKFVEESMDKFLLDKMKQKAEIVPGVLGEEAPSIGAACLGRRKLFTEV